MLARVKWIVSSLLVLLFSGSLAFAQNAQEPGRRFFTQQQLDQMLAPIALYPDQLLSQILMAATYPADVVEAARWSRDNPGLNGDRAVRAAERIDWDPSVKSLVAFPQVLDLMDQKLTWTEDLGDAFLSQRAQVMDTVQYLRDKAYSAGNLQSNDQFRVAVAGASYVIEPVNPEVVYVPYYNPRIIYGSWWWPAYQPVYWAPWHGYHVRPGYAHGYAWGPAIPVSRGFFFGAPDWHRHSVHIVNVNNYYYRSTYVNRQVNITHNAAFTNGAPHVWQHDVAHRRDVSYRDAAWRQNAAHAAAPADTRHDSHELGPRGMNGRGTHAIAPAPAVPAQPAARVEAATAARSSTPHREAWSPPSAARVEAASEARHGHRERDAFVNRGRGTVLNAPVAAPAQTETHHAPAAVQPAVARIEPQRSAAPHAHDPRFDSNRAMERAHQSPPQPAAATPVVRAPVAAAAPPVAVSAPPVMNQPRVAPAPTPAQPPAAASRPPVAATPAVAGTPRAPEGAGRNGDARQGGAHERGGRPAPPNNTVAAAPPANTQGAQAPGNTRGNGGNSRQRE